ncbi:MAG: NTP transferase domain-containing protein [Pseudomonadota bacterium]
MTARKFAALILAAGYSSRMKAFKPLLPLGDATVLEQAARPFLLDDKIETLVVTGCRAGELRPVLKRNGLGEVFNPEFDRGMFSSVKAGVKALPRGTAAFFVLPVDIPLARPFTIGKLLKKFEEEAPRLIYPTFRGRAGHPPLIAADLAGPILAWNGDGGLKGALASFRDEALYLETPDRNILFDMDQPDEYQAMLDRWSRRGRPTREEAAMILESAGLPPPALGHCRATARLAEGLALALNRTGPPTLDLDLIHAAALLHDLGKGRPNHAQAGAARLDEMGFFEIAPLVKSHSDPVLELADEVTALEVIYLADKMLMGEEIVPPVERFLAAVNKGGLDQVRKKAYDDRLAAAQKITARLEARLGVALAEVIKGLLAAG